MKRPILFSVVLLMTSHVAAVDKNGFSPQAISRPSGPGSIQGLGESFQPQLNTGSGSYSVRLELPTGSGGTTPSLRLIYNTGYPNGCLGMGWRLSGIPSMARSTDDGVPFYVDGADGVDNDRDGIVDNPQEVDRYSGVDGEELVPLVDGSFRAESEGAFFRYQRVDAHLELLVLPLQFIQSNCVSEQERNR